MGRDVVSPGWVSVAAALPDASHGRLPMLLLLLLQYNVFGQVFRKLLWQEEGDDPAPIR
jgi:hypothetical protein